MIDFRNQRLASNLLPDRSRTRPGLVSFLDLDGDDVVTGRQHATTGAASGRPAAAAASAEVDEGAVQAALRGAFELPHRRPSRRSR